METIGKFRTNFLGKNKSFKIGFNNRSPFSYISTTGPEVPARYDGGVPLVNFTPDQYSTAFDSSDAVRAEHEAFKKAGEATGKVVGAVGAAVAGGIKASNNPGAGFGDFIKGAGEGFKDYDGLLGDEAQKGVDSGMSDIRTNRGKKSTSNSGGGTTNIIQQGGGNSGGGDTGIDYGSLFAQYNTSQQPKGKFDDLEGDEKLDAIYESIMGKPRGN